VVRRQPRVSYPRIVYIFVGQPGISGSRLKELSTTK
jgi:hypothetical protein